jgi:predicted nucleic acid-binding protein
VIVVADSSSLITLARARQLDLLREFYSEIAVPPEVYDEVTVAGAGLGSGERGALCLASALGADMVLIDEGRARRAARGVGLAVAGSIAILERGAKLGKIADLRSVYLNLLDQGIRFDRRLLERSLANLGLAGLGRTSPQT